MNREIDIERTLQKRIVSGLPVMEEVLPQVLETYRSIRDAFRNGETLFICGNGGSHSDSLHITGELLKNFEGKRPLPEALEKKLRALGPEGSRLAENLNGALPSVALGTNTVLSTAVGNDQGCEFVFAQELLGLGNRGDILLGISTSGNSLNIAQAVRTAKALEMKSVVFTGEEKSTLSDLADIAVPIPARSTARVQELHIILYHALCAALEESLFPG